MNECISSLDFSKSGDYVSAGLIDERVLVYKIEENNQFKETYKFEGNTLGVIDTKFNSIGNSYNFFLNNNKIIFYYYSLGI